MTLFVTLAAGSGSSGGGRTALTADTDYYVRSDGSDSNNGLANTAGGAWLTPQHAINFLSDNIDGGGFAVKVNIGAGTFVGVDLLPMFNFKRLFLSGAGSASTTLTGAASGHAPISAADIIVATPVYYSGFTLNCTAGSGGGACVRLGIGNQLWGVFPDFSTSDIVYVANASPGYCVWVLGNSFWSDGEGVGTATIGAGSWLEAFHLEPGAQDVQIGDAYTISGTPAFTSAFITAADASAVVYGTFTGAATGTRFIVKQNGSIDANDAAGTFFPGNANGQILSGGQYSGITDFQGAIASLPAALMGAHAYVTNASSGLTFGSTVGSTGSIFAPVYADGTSWRYG